MVYRKAFLGFLSFGLALTGALSPSIAQGANFEHPLCITNGRDCISRASRVSHVELETRLSKQTKYLIQINKILSPDK